MRFLVKVADLLQSLISGLFMDPITQGALGASAGQVFHKKEKIVAASLMAGLAAMSPDLDVLIQSEKDPLLFLVYHRQFSHSLFFIPFGALICCMVLHPLIGKRNEFLFRQSYFFCFAGYATHALLDACTTYGTLLLWPFSQERFAWNNISVVDPAYTLPIIFALWLGIKKQSHWPARFIVIWIFLYPLMGYLQKQKAEEAAWLYLEKNSEVTVTRLNAKPSLLNIVLWKIVYESDSHYYVDAVNIGLFQSAKHAVYFPGDSVEKLDLERDFPWLVEDSQQAIDVERFRWFSNGFVAKDDGKFTGKQNRIMDVRYSIVPNEIHPLWSIELNPEAQDWEHVNYENHRDNSREARQRFLDMLFVD